MRDENSKKSKLSWSTSLVRKWFNIKTKANDYHSDCFAGEVGDGEWRTSCSGRDPCSAKKSRREKLPRRSVSADHANRLGSRYDNGYLTYSHDYRLFVATWNVGGKSPPSHLKLNEWLHTSPPADIYVLGFQEVVPLNASNILGTEDTEPAKKWVALIRRALNHLPGSNTCSSSYQTPSPAPNPVVEIEADFSRSLRRQKNPAFFQRRSFQSFNSGYRADGEFNVPRASMVDRRFSVCERISFGSRPSDYDTSTSLRSDRMSFGSRPSDYDTNLRCDSDDENMDDELPGSVFYSPMVTGHGAPLYPDDKSRQPVSSRYCLVASKQMVGIFLTIWARNDIRDHVKNLKVSCVGRGLMGYLGNKGSISVSMMVHRTSFCFICSHLTSGQKDGDELRRNSDVMEILRKTRFPRVNGMGNEKSPETILEHDRIIWLGDLNYRIALSYRSVSALVEMHNWKQLLEKDQLRVEQRHGRVFIGWKEGRIYFPPTYKYSCNSDRYAGDDLHSKEKRRTPAWCDRILWYGTGLNQLCYVRGESRFSDHRPVYSIFIAEVEMPGHNLVRTTSCSRSVADVGGVFPYPHGYMDLNFY